METDATLKWSLRYGLVGWLLGRLVGDEGGERR